jgi:DNA-binding MarR family transcriptional regulator
MTDRCLLCGQELQRRLHDEEQSAAAGPSLPAAALLPVGPTSRRNDPSTSKAAAERALPHAETKSWQVMQTIGTGALAYDEIAQRTGLNPTTVSRRLTDICRLGLGVSLMPSPEHRAKRVKLTRAGLALLNGDSSLAEQVAA